MPVEAGDTGTRAEKGHREDSRRKDPQMPGTPLLTKAIVVSGADQTPRVTLDFKTNPRPPPNIFCRCV